VVLLLFALSSAFAILAPTTAPSTQAATQGSGARTVFLVGIDFEPSWRDFAALTTVPAARHINNGQPVILLVPTDSEAEDRSASFLAQYKPEVTYAVAIARPVQSIPGEDQFAVAAELATRFWGSVKTAVLAPHEAYASALLGATLAARLDLPLLYVTPSTVPSVTRSTLQTLQSDTVLFVGSSSTSVLAELQDMGIAVSVLPDAEAVTRFLRQSTLTVNYVVLSNPWDRGYDGQVTKLSLLSPILAADHGGMIYPKEVVVQYKVSFQASATTALRPTGATQGGEKRFFASDFRTDSPARAAGSTWTLHPVNGHYASGKMMGIGGSWIEHSFCLAASAGAKTEFDRLLIDLNGSGDFSDDEVVGPGQVFALGGREYVAEGVAGDGESGGVEDLVEVTFRTWALGTFTINGMTSNFAATCTGYADPGLGFYDTVDLDFDSDGVYGEPGEGPYRTSDTVTLGGKTFVLTVGTGLGLDPMSLKFTTPDAREIAAELRDFYVATGITPTYLALLGYHDALPFGLPIRPRAYADVEDFASDLPYAQVDDDMFADISVGRIVAGSIYAASLVVARTIVYSELLNSGWQRMALTLSGPREQEAITRLAARYLENVGFVTTHVAETETWQDSYLKDKSFVFHDNHASPAGWQGGPSATGVRALALDPVVAMSGGCMSVMLDATSKEQSIALAFLDAGAVAYIGNTRPASNPIFSYFGVLWDGMSHRGLTLGQAHRRGQNFKLLEVAEKSNTDTEYDQIAAYEVTLLGDPALSLGPQFTTPLTRPAHTVVNGRNIEYNGPGDYWRDVIIMEPGRTEQMWSGAGLLFTNSMNDIWFYVEVLIEDQVSEVAQTTQVAFGLGWTGEWFLDKGFGELDRLLWRVKPLIYEPSSGTIVAETKEISYLLVASGSQPFSCSPPSVSPSSGAAPLTAQFSASCTGGAEPYSYSWVFGDGDTSILQNPSHTYSNAGTYSWSLTVIDSGSKRYDASGTVVVDRIPTSLTISFSPTTVDLPRGEYTTITVLLNPSLSGRSIRLYSAASLAGPWTPLDTCFTDGNGACAKQWFPPSPGSTNPAYYYLAAEWDGDSQYSNARADTGALSPPHVTVIPEFESPAAVVLLATLATLILLRRKHLRIRDH